MTSRIRMLGYVIKFTFLFIILTLGLIYVDFVTALTDGRISLKPVQGERAYLNISNGASFPLGYTLGNESGLVMPGESALVELKGRVGLVGLSYAGLIEVRIGVAEEAP